MAGFDPSIEGVARAPIYAMHLRDSTLDAFADGGVVQVREQQVVQLVDVAVEALDRFASRAGYMLG